MTLAEVVMALAVTAIIAAAVATMMHSVAGATATQNDLRGLSVRQGLVSARLNGALRCARMVLALGSDYLVLWMAETNFNEAPDLSELRRIERNPATGELWSYRAPPDLADDTRYDLATTDFNDVTGALKGSERLPGELWGTDITEWTIHLNHADPRQAGFVGYRLTVALEAGRETAVGGMAMRN